MRLPILGAAVAGTISTIMKSDEADFGPRIIKTGGFIILLGTLDLIEVLRPITTVIALIYITIFFLNDGYDLVQKVSSL